MENKVSEPRTTLPLISTRGSLRLPTTSYNHPSHPTRPTYSSEELNRPKIDLSRPSMTTIGYQWLPLTIFCCLSVCEVSVTPDQISTFSNINRHTSPLLTMYHLIPSSTNIYWPSTSHYRYILTQYHQIPLIIHHIVRHSSVNWIISLFRTHLMSHAQYTWSSFGHFLGIFWALFLFN